MYSKLPNLVLGFHGCDRTTFDAVIRQGQCLEPSENDYDWLGHGIYFWEGNLSRAWDYAKELKRRNRIKTEAVIGAVIDLAYCLNLLETESLQIVKMGYKILKRKCDLVGIPLPTNSPGGSKTDLLLRRLDCAVIETVHEYMKEERGRAYDSVRGVFVEGEALYDGAGFHAKNHIQICIRNPNCIKGFFAPRDLLDSHPNP